MMGREIKGVLDMNKLGNLIQDPLENKIKNNLPLPKNMQTHKVPEKVKKLHFNLVKKNE